MRKISFAIRWLLLLIILLFLKLKLLLLLANDYRVALLALRWDFSLGFVLFDTCLCRSMDLDWTWFSITAFNCFHKDLIWIMVSRRSLPSSRVSTISSCCPKFRARSRILARSSILVFMKSERWHFAHIVVVIQLVERLFVQSDVNFAIFARARSIDADLLSSILTIIATRSLPVLKSLYAMEGWHVNRFVVLLQVCVLDTKDLELCLWLSLFLTERFLDIGDHLHGVFYLACQELILAFHVS